VPKRRKERSAKQRNSIKLIQENDRNEQPENNDIFGFSSYDNNQNDQSIFSIKLPPTCTTSNPSCAPEKGQSCSVAGSSCFLYHRLLMCCENCPADC